jgi:SagB-type dehydrogenase family enzyme
MSDSLDTVLAYHQRSKHHFQRYAAGPHGLDWANQPDPFRTFAGATRLELPLLAQATDSRFADLDRPGAILARPLTLANLSALLELAFGLSAWKQNGDTRWALRCNPSSGNLHPTEAYVASAGLEGLDAGIYHYVSRDHCLERRCSFSPDAASCLPATSFLIGLSSIHWREAWKYGERAFRYCQHDVGHAIAAVSYAAAVLGWKTRLLTRCSDADSAALLGLDRDEDFGPAEREQPDVQLLVSATPDQMEPDIGALADLARQAPWQGHANAVSPNHGQDWPVIEAVAGASRKPATAETALQAEPWPAPLPCPSGLLAASLIRQRRSAQAFDGVTKISAGALYRMLDMTLPRVDSPPWSAWPWPPRIHLLLFVHRVEGLSPGLYLLLRNHGGETTARQGFTAEFEWQPVSDCPAHFRLFRLAPADARNAARALACHQDIAADSAFSLAMLAEYETALAEGPWMYRRLFWEAGMVGQVLYLEAEAAGVRGTGIGCFFDDGVHDLLGLQGQALQDLYHFTVGGALADTRLQTLPPYAHLEGR